MYTVKQVAELANVTVRTLHHYDEIGLLKPAQVGKNGYRYYDDAALLRLQQILLYRELGLELMHIKSLLDSPSFDVQAALQAHRAALQDKIVHLNALIRTVDDTLAHLQRGQPMSKKRLFEGFSDEKQKDYEREIRLSYGPEIVRESQRNWGSYSAAQKEIVMEEGNQIYSDIVQAIESDLPAHHADVQALMTRWHEHIRYFYEPTLEILRGLGELYNTHPDFLANFEKIHPNLAPYMREAINVYVDELETAEIVRLLAEDEQQKAHR